MKPKRTPDQILEIRADVAELINTGLRQRDVVERIREKWPEVDYSYGMLLDDLRDMRAEWLERSREAVDQQRADMLAKLDTMEMEVWEQWRRSCGTIKKTRSEVGKRGDSAVDIDTTEITDGLGDPRYMAQLINIFERRSKLLGLDSPVKIASTDPTGKYPVGIVLMPTGVDSVSDWEAKFAAAAGNSLLQGDRSAG